MSRQPQMTRLDVVLYLILVCLVAAGEVTTRKRTDAILARVEALHAEAIKRDVDISERVDQLGAGQGAVLMKLLAVEDAYGYALKAQTMEQIGRTDPETALQMIIEGAEGVKGVLSE